MGAVVASADAPQMRSVMQGLLLPAAWPPHAKGTETRHHHSGHRRRPRPQRGHLPSLQNHSGPRRPTCHRPPLLSWHANFALTVSSSTPSTPCPPVTERGSSKSSSPAAASPFGYHHQRRHGPCSGYPMRSAGRGPEGVTSSRGRANLLPGRPVDSAADTATVRTGIGLTTWGVIPLRNFKHSRFALAVVIGPLRVHLVLVREVQDWSAPRWMPQREGKRWDAARADMGHRKPTVSSGQAVDDSLGAGAGPLAGVRGSDG